MVTRATAMQFWQQVRTSRGSPKPPVAEGERRVVYLTIIEINQRGDVNRSVFKLDVYAMGAP